MGKVVYHSQKQINHGQNDGYSNIPSKFYDMVLTRKDLVERPTL